MGNKEQVMGDVLRLSVNSNNHNINAKSMNECTPTVCILVQ